MEPSKKKIDQAKKQIFLSYIQIVLSLIIIGLILKCCYFNQCCGSNGAASENDTNKVISEKMNENPETNIPETEESVMIDASSKVLAEPEANSSEIPEESNATTPDNTASPAVSDEEDLWNNAQKNKTLFSFNKYLKKYPNGKYKTEAEKGMIDYEVKDIFSKDHGKLPPMDASMPKGGKKGKTSNVEIKNDTKYVLTVRYSGPQSAKVDIKAGEKKSIILLNGDYKTTASVNSEHVKHFGSIEKLEGMNYNTEFYIK